MPFINQHNNAGTVSKSLERGWRDRQAKAQGQAAANASWREIDAERQRAYAEKAARDQAEAQERKTAANLRVCCPVCDTGSVSLEHLPANSAPDTVRLAVLAGIATDMPHNETFTPHPSYQLHRPRKVEAIQFDGVIETGADASSDEDAIAALTGKRKGR